MARASLMAIPKSSEQFEIVFEGPAVKDGLMDAGELAIALTGWNQLFRRADLITNDRATTTIVLVESEFRRGSFIVGIQLDQFIAEQVQQALVQHPIISITGVGTIMGFLGKKSDSLLSLWKLAKGKRPNGAREVGQEVELTLGDTHKRVSHTTYHLYKDPAIRAAFVNAVDPLRYPGVNRIAIRKGNIEQAAIEKSEADYFEPDPLTLRYEEAAREGTREAVLIVSKLSFTEGTKWTFFEAGATVIARVEDPDFWTEVHKHNIKFGEGDRLRVLLSWKIVQKKKLVQENTILKVIEVLDSPEQIRLA